jgi:hypothetical protein
MDGTADPKFKLEQIKIGDIVKIMRYDYNAYSVPVYGMVIGKQDTSQIYMFPAVEVFLFETQKIQICPIGTIEVISHA